MAVVTLEEAKQYLRVDSADEDAFISGLLETGEGMCADMARMEAGSWCRPYAPCCSGYGRKCSDGGRIGK